MQFNRKMLLILVGFVVNSVSGWSGLELANSAVDFGEVDDDEVDG